MSDDFDDKYTQEDLEAEAEAYERESQELDADDIKRWFAYFRSVNLHNAVCLSMGLRPEVLRNLLAGKGEDKYNDCSEYRYRMARTEGAIQNGTLETVRENYVEPIKYCKWAVAAGHALPPTLFKLLQTIEPFTTESKTTKRKATSKPLKQDVLEVVAYYNTWRGQGYLHKQAIAKTTQHFGISERTVFNYRSRCKAKTSKPDKS